MNKEQILKEIKAKEEEIKQLKEQLRIEEYEEELALYKFLVRNSECPISFEIDWIEYKTEYVLQPGTYHIEENPKYLNCDGFYINCTFFTGRLIDIKNLKVIYDKNYNNGKTSV